MQRSFYLRQRLKSDEKLLSLLILGLERMKGFMTSSVLWTYWTVMLLVSIVPFYSNIIDELESIYNASFVLFNVYCGFLVLRFIEKRSRVYQDLSKMLFIPIKMLLLITLFHGATAIEIANSSIEEQLPVSWTKRNPRSINKPLFFLALIATLIMTGRLLWRYRFLLQNKIRLARGNGSRTGNISAHQPPLQGTDDAGRGSFPNGIDFLVDVRADLLFVIDGSMSIPRHHYDKIVRFCALLIWKFPVRERKLTTACIVVCDNPVIKGRFNEFSSRNVAALDMLKIQQPIGQTARADRALQCVLSERLFSTEQGASPKSVKIVVLVTHLQPSPITPCIRISREIRKCGINIIAVAIAGKEPIIAQLVELTGDEQNVFSTLDFDSLPHLDNHILSRARKLCNDGLSMD
ncbi:uncharacterized protein LOC131943095 isoform X2 [Physella acuta]|uniref:uncharacterized protein LOC131943095 isoform X2 n=1 Tax=Physella acuta TaxID=109671 RepID=UPI0027DB6CA1|nr:uncharacterized protein LOC131943095 isoform X2 [Physella acuta]